MSDWFAGIQLRRAGDLLGLAVTPEEILGDIQRRAAETLNTLHQ